MQPARSVKCISSFAFPLIIFTFAKTYRLKNFLLITLILCLTVPYAATYTWLHFERKQVKREVREKIISGLEKEDLVLLSFLRTESEKQLRWVHPGEFEYRGQMFDIVRTETREDTVLYWCWKDEKEQSLKKQMEELAAKAAGTHPLNKEKQKRYIGVFKIFFIMQDHSLQSVICQPLNSYYQSGKSFYCSMHYPPPVPPPESA